MPWSTLGCLRVCATGEGSRQADRRVHNIAEDLRAGKIETVIARLERMRPKSAQVRESLDGLIRYYRENASRMHYDEYLRLGYGIGSGAPPGTVYREGCPREVLIDSNCHNCTPDPTNALYESCYVYKREKGLIKIMVTDITGASAEGLTAGAFRIR